MELRMSIFWANFHFCVNLLFNGIKSSCWIKILLIVYANQNRMQCILVLHYDWHPDMHAWNQAIPTLHKDYNHVDGKFNPHIKLDNNALFKMKCSWQKTQLTCLFNQNILLWYCIWSLRSTADSEHTSVLTFLFQCRKIKPVHSHYTKSVEHCVLDDTRLNFNMQHSLKNSVQHISEIKAYTFTRITLQFKRLQLLLDQK